MIGVQISTAALRDRVINECFQRGLLVLSAGPSTIRLSPPLVIDEVQADCAVQILADVIAGLAAPGKN